MNHRDLQRQHRNQQRYACRESLNLALNANRELQQQIQKQLYEIYQCQSQNRQSAASCIEYLQRCNDADGNVLQQQLPRQQNRSRKRKKTKAEQNGESDGNKDDIPRGVPKLKTVKALLFQSDHHSAEKTTTTPSKTTATGTTDTATNLQNIMMVSNKKGTDRKATNPSESELDPYGLSSYKKRKQFKYDPKRKWNAEFFIDPLGLRPADNEDVIRRKRQRLQSDGNTKNNNENNVFFHYKCPPWSKYEIELLKRIVDDAGPHETTTITTTTTDSNKDWNQIANNLQTATAEASLSSSKVIVLSDTARARTPKECELMYRSILASSYDLPKRVMVYVLEKVHQHQELCQKATTIMCNTSSDNKISSQETIAIDWKAMAEELTNNNNTKKNEKRNNDNDDDDDDDSSNILITPWQLFTNYQRHWKTPQERKATSWKASIEQDQMLIRYLALQGPQFVWDKSEASHLGQRLFRDSIPKQLIHRSMSHGVNPNLMYTKNNNNNNNNNNNDTAASASSSSWTVDDERKLVLCMAIYRHYPEPTILAATHFFPYRTARQVSHKWDRSLCPQRNSQVAFSKEEDALLLTKAREGKLNFGEIARQEALFVENCRGPHQLYHRWRDIIASPEEIATRTIQEQWKTTILSPNDDFVLRVQTREKKMKKNDTLPSAPSNKDTH